jgi:hypothetical protein
MSPQYETGVWIFLIFVFAAIPIPFTDSELSSLSQCGEWPTVPSGLADFGPHMMGDRPKLEARPSG